MTNDELHRLTTEALVSGLPASLKAALDAALAKGATREQVWAFARRQAPEGGLTYLACHAYLFPGRETVDYLRP